MFRDHSPHTILMWSFESRLSARTEDAQR